MDDVDANQPGEVPAIVGNFMNAVNQVGQLEGVPGKMVEEAKTKMLNRLQGQLSQRQTSLRIKSRGIGVDPNSPIAGYSKEFDLLFGIKDYNIDGKLFSAVLGNLEVQETNPEEVVDETIKERFLKERANGERGKTLYTGGGLENCALIVTTSSRVMLVVGGGDDEFKRVIAHWSGGKGILG